MGVIFAKSSAAPDPTRRAKEILIGIVALAGALFVASGAAPATHKLSS